METSQPALWNVSPFFLPYLTLLHRLDVPFENHFEPDKAESGKPSRVTPCSTVYTQAQQQTYLEVQLALKKHLAPSSYFFASTLLVGLALDP